ncbi:MAG TPA: subclass B3 metallo-beta-lactamase [Candidatus Angelobacter sp.]|nr:subclass B3 metallo-beta-lactamase [Candidatus Angelobacter sp.]
MRRTRAAILFFLLGSVLLLGQQDSPLPGAPFRLIGNIYYVGGEDLTSYLIVTPKGLILLDGGSAALAPVIKKNIEQLGFRVEDIRYLLNSHAHMDHAGGLAMLKKLSGAKMVASEGDRPLLERRVSEQSGDRVSFLGVQVDKVIRDGDEVELGGVSLHALITPGHTPGCTTWTMRVSEDGKKYDVVFFCSLSVLEHTRLVDNKAYPQIISDYESSYARLKQLHCDVFLAPHGSFFNLKEKSALLRKGVHPNPFVDANEFRWFVAASEREFRQKLAEQRGSVSNVNTR